MASRRAVLLTPSLSSRPVQPLSCTQITRETPLIPIFVFKSLRTLSFSVSCKSCVCYSYANGRGGYQQFPTWSESLAACNPSLTSINRPPLVRCVDSSSPLQLSTFNRVSFPSSRLTLSQRSAKSFTIRTSKTPLPQLLYNPHLQKQGAGVLPCFQRCNLPLRVRNLRANFRALPPVTGHGLRDTTHNSFQVEDSPSGNSVGSAGGASAMASSSG